MPPTEYNYSKLLKCHIYQSKWTFRVIIDPKGKRIIQTHIYAHGNVFIHPMCKILKCYTIININKLYISAHTMVLSRLSQAIDW